MDIRKLREEDIETVIALTQLCENLVPERSSIYWVFWKFFRDSCFLAWEETELIGFLLGLLGQTTPLYGYVHMLGVHPRHRNKGAGRVLLDTFDRQISKHGAEGVYLTTLPDNDKAIGFYQKVGFTEIREISKVGSRRYELIRPIFQERL